MTLLLASQTYSPQKEKLTILYTIIFLTARELARSGPKRGIVVGDSVDFVDLKMKVAKCSTKSGLVVGEGTRWTL